MGFDNECIVNIQSLAGEYFCPVCRTLVYPHEALQTQCTHLYCKPCLSYVVSSTQACPYDGYLVTEAGSKPLMESNKALAETIGKTTVHCLYHRSGCMWQGPLSECTTHCSGCAFGNSPVVCNRCGIQIVHRQVQEHAQTCNGTNTQPQGSEIAQDAVASGVAVSTDQSKLSNQAAAASQSQASNATHNLNQPATANTLTQAMLAPVAPTPEQQYYQQYQQQYPGYDPYQQAYQQYYPYQQQPAQQVQQPPLEVQAQPQPQPQSQPQHQQQVQTSMSQTQPQAQNHLVTPAQGQGQPQSQTHPQAHSQVPSNGQPQSLYSQATVLGANQNQGQVNTQQQGHPGGQLLAHGHMHPQSYSHAQPHLVQNHAQPHMQVPQYQQPHPQMHHSQPPQVQPYPQIKPQLQQPYSQAHSHFQPHPLRPLQPQSQPVNPQYHPVQSVASHPAYTSQPHQQIQNPPSQQHPMQGNPSGPLPPGQMPAQLAPLPPETRPPQPNLLSPQQRPAMHQHQQPLPPQYVQHPQAFAGQASAQLQGQSHHAGPIAQHHPQVRPQAPPQPMQQPPLGYVQPQQVNALPHSMSSQNYVGRPAMLNHGAQPQQPTQSSGSASHVKQPQFVPSQPVVNQSNMSTSNQPHVSSTQQPLGGVERKAEREAKSPSLKKSEGVDDYGASFNEVKPEAGMNNECKPEDDQRKDESFTKGVVSELHQVQGVIDDSVATQRVKEEGKDGSLDHSPVRKSSQNKAENGGVANMDSLKHGEASVNFKGEGDNGNPRGSTGRDRIQRGQIDDVSGGFPSKGAEPSSHSALSEQGKSPHALFPHGISGQQQIPAASLMLQSVSQTGRPLPQPSSHIRPLHGNLPHGPHPGEHFQSPGLNQPGPFHPEVPFGGSPGPGSASMMGGGANNFAHNSRGYGPQSSRFIRMSQGEPLGPPFSSAPLPHGPDGQVVSRHPGLMESEMYQSQRPPHFNNRRMDSHLPYNTDRGLYGQPFGVESNSMKMMRGPPPGHDLPSAPVFRDEKFRSSAGVHPDNFFIGPASHHEQSELKGNLKQLPAHLGSEDSLKFGSHLSKPMSGYGMDGPSRFFDKDPHGYSYDTASRLHPGVGGLPSGFFPPNHPNESHGGRPLHASMHDANRGRFDNNRQNPEFSGPMHGFGWHHMDRLPPSSPGNLSRPFGGPHNIDVDSRERERRPFGERFPMGPPGHMHRGEIDGPGKPRSGEPFGLRSLSGRNESGFGFFQDYSRPGNSNGLGGFSHQLPFGESFSTMSIRPHLGEPGFKSSYSRQGFQSDGGFYAGGSDSFDHLMKRKPVSMGWCRICRVDCETVEDLDMHGQTHEHQRMAMDMVISIKKNNAKKQKTSNDLSPSKEASSFRHSEIHARANMS
ncbi:hypothetical protein SSX86_024637 [Deinandra increscens subsp. villosa]|uniref:RING-type domain-containing protein n=1 Tax=Deinandra increscens subsp. villosa TaxID=3103831 RepID=A0AAP0GKR6_9ASTR